MGSLEAVLENVSLVVSGLPHVPDRLIPVDASIPSLSAMVEPAGKGKVLVPCKVKTLASPAGRVSDPGTAYTYELLVAVVADPPPTS